MTKQLTIPEALIEAKRYLKKGNYHIALQIYSSILQHQPNNTIALNELGKLQETIQNNNISQSQLENSLQNQVTELINLFNLGHFLKLEQSCKELLVQFPNSIQVINILGAAFLKQNKYHEAITFYNKAIELNPNYADAYNNRGIVFKDIEKYHEALSDYNKAIELNLNHVDAYNNRGNIFKDLAKYQEALADYTRAIKLKPDYNKAYYNIGDVLKRIIFLKYDTEIVKIIIVLLDKEIFIKPIDIEKKIIALLKFDPTLKRILKDNSTNKLEEIDQTIGKLSNMPLLLKLMQVCQITDLELENLFASIRSNILLSISNINESSEILKFQEALALQCFTNEYIYSQSTEEIKALAALEKKIESILSQDQQPSLVEILCFASYKTLHEYEWCDKLLLPKELDEISNRLVLEPKEEKRLKSKLPILKKISNKISSEVQEQYEENPYPRWVKIRLSLEPSSITKIVKMNNLKLFNNSITQIEAPDILVAGCGTGQQAIDVATAYKSSKVVAIDLSLSSLAYAKRKTQELGIKNIDYMQADILDLDKLGKQFDIIDCGGVLHHMDNPMAGWKVLTACLKSGGLMRIGLYSELARKDINKIRQEIVEQKIETNIESIKAFRNSLMKSNKSHHKKVFSSNDFYSLSESRDLLFHVQEHQFTLPQIDKFLSKLGLKFCGFKQNTIIKKAFTSQYPEVDSIYNLNKWDNFEKENSHIFGGMYQFWCQK